MTRRSLTDVVAAVRRDEREHSAMEVFRGRVLADLEEMHEYALFYRDRVENPLDPATVPRGYATHCARSDGRYSVNVAERIRHLTALDLVEQPDWTLAFIDLARHVVRNRGKWADKMLIQDRSVGETRACCV